MTFSIVAKCSETGQFGVAAATAMPAVGKLLSHAQAGIGAVATQAQLNPYLGIDGLALLRERLSSVDVRKRLIEMDPRTDLRQFAIIDPHGTVAAWTGAGCPSWAGAIEHDGFSVQGNRLASEHVLSAIATTFQQVVQAPLAERLLEAMAAGVAAGGDTKGEQSATIYVVETEEYPLWDIRVDEHRDPVGELRRLYGIFKEQLLPHIRKMPTRANPAGEHDEYAA